MKYKTRPLQQARQQEQESTDFLGDRLNELELYVRRTGSLSDRLYREVINSHMRPFADGVQGFPRMIRDGKSGEGTICLEAFHRGGMLAITISDDGRGINREQLRQKIINKNLATADIVTQLSDAELMEFLFLPGFSTAKQVTEISGRGVGLDIAKSMVQDVGGTVRGISQPGKAIAKSVHKGDRI